MTEKICVLGLGHAGLPTALSFAEMGWNVVGVDNDVSKVRLLQSGDAPFHEPGVDKLLRTHLENGNFIVTDDASQAIRSSAIVIVCVGTPQSDNGSTDLSFLKSAVDTVANNIRGYTLVVEKSTVTPGTAQDIVKPRLDTCGQEGELYDLVVNPEFLREGAAIFDCLHPERLVFGVNSARAEQTLRELYQPILSEKHGNGHDSPSVIVTNWTTAELIKQASNAFLATKISFINMMADICDIAGANVLHLAEGLGSDRRINPHYLSAGMGFGGQCLPKDLRSLAAYGRDHGVDVAMLESVDGVNISRLDKIINQLSVLIGDISERKIAVWGLSFKPGTDDVAEAPSIGVISRLLDNGADVRMYDPAAGSTFLEKFPTSDNNIRLCNSSTEAVQGVDALVILTDWEEFVEFDLDLLMSSMESPVIVDGRNCMDSSQMLDRGFIYSGFGL